MYIIKVISHTLSYSNSLINPFIYVFIGTKFRNHIRLEFSKLFQLLCFITNRSRSVKEKNRARTTKATEFSLKIYKSNNHECKKFFNKNP
jgi:hypothetical protein